MIRVQNLSSVGIIYRAFDPNQVVIETKTPGYPAKIFVGKGLLLGGNWIGKATNDGGPIGTYLREIDEELSFDNPVVDPNEMDTLFGTGHLGRASEKRSIEATPEDTAALNSIKNAIRANAISFGLYLQFVPKYVFDSAKPANKTADYRGAVSVFEIPLSEDTWTTLCELQNRYGNLSNESQCLITSTSELVKKGWQIGWGQDRVLQQFFLRKGIEEAVGMSLMSAISSLEIGLPMETYDEYLGMFDVEKIPDGIARPS